MQDENLEQTPQVVGEEETVPPDLPEASQMKPDHYVPRPKWQLVLAWVFLILIVLGTLFYYYWIAHKY